MKAHDIQPGDVILHLGDTMTVHYIHRYPQGSASLRARFTSNPAGVDWSLFIGEEEEVPLVARGVAALDPRIRTLLPG